MRTKTAPQFFDDMEAQVDRRIRDLLGLPACGCRSLGCPDIGLNMIAHPNEQAVRDLIAREVRRQRRLSRAGR
jgi:hypothetical protein